VSDAVLLVEGLSSFSPLVEGLSSFSPLGDDRGKKDDDENEQVRPP